MKITLPNWFKPKPVTSPQVGEENQFGSSRGLRFGPLRINKTGIFANNGSTDSVVVNSTGFHGYNNTGTEQITIDSLTGLDIKDDAAASVFKAVIQGTNVGDVTIGNYSGGKGLFYDKSGGTFDFKGTVTASSFIGGDITIGSGNNVFIAGANGIQLGHATFASAPFNVTVAGALTSTSGAIGGWDIASTTLSKNNVILDSAGSITVANGDDKVVLDISSSVGYVSFYAGGALKGRLRGTTAGAGGVAVVSGDMALDNNKSFLVKGTGTEYAAFSVDGSNVTIIESSDGDQINIQDHDGGSMMTVTKTNCYWPTHTLQLKEISEPSNPGTADTGLIFMKDNGSGKTQLCVRFKTGATQVFATEP